MLSLEALLLFSVTTFFVVLAPGPAALAVAAEAASNGFRRSTLVILGVALANVVFFTLSALGIGTLIVASESLFFLIKWIGVAYLFYLGVGALFGSSSALTIRPSTQDPIHSLRVFLRGFSIELSNPKALLYFIALLPQFINTDYPIVPQIIILIAITMLFDFICYSFYGYLGWKSIKLGMSPRVVRVVNKSAGVLLILVATLMVTLVHP